MSLRCWNSCSGSQHPSDKRILLLLSFLLLFFQGGGEGKTKRAPAAASPAASDSGSDLAVTAAAAASVVEDVVDVVEEEAQERSREHRWWGGGPTGWGGEVRAEKRNRGVGWGLGEACRHPNKSKGNKCCPCEQNPLSIYLSFFLPHSLSHMHTLSCFLSLSFSPSSLVFSLTSPSSLSLILLLNFYCSLFSLSLSFLFACSLCDVTHSLPQ